MSTYMPTDRLQQREPQLDLPAPGEMRPHSKSSWLKWLVLLVVLAITGFIGWRVYASQQETAAATQKASASSNRPTPVLIAEVQQRTMPIYLSALGTVTAYNTVTVKSRVDGQLVKVNFKEGQQVKQGALLLQIDPAPYAAAVEQAEGQYAKDEAMANNGKAEAARYGALFQAGVVSKESQQTQEALYGQAQGALKADLAAIHAAKVNLAYTRITSPIDAQVGLRQVDVGNIVHASDPTGLVVLTQLQPISVIFTLPEDQLPPVRKKLLASENLKVDAYDRAATTKIATGNLLTADNQIDPTTGTDKLKAVFPNKDQALFPNQFVNIRLILEDRPKVLIIPAAALQMGSTGNFVYVVKADNTVDVRPIASSITQGPLLLLEGGLKPGERVVIDGQEKIHAGSKVVISHGTAGGKSGTDGKGGVASKADGSMSESSPKGSKADETSSPGTKLHDGKGKSKGHDGREGKKP